MSCRGSSLESNSEARFSKNAAVAVALKLERILARDLVLLSLPFPFPSPVFDPTTAQYQKMNQIIRQRYNEE
jgi:hypothetical protein